ncbi:nucleotide pyrophosphohydrolase [Heliophilum fasciatum]|uniref:NTP pyrophosphatase (Non-canonical NTP hydrolase) n=1 Tax=Heliophilum fasciatum TaxID=35700 RepID=A0A4R2RJV1_9FIRM|nr:nucleotide pyrophosphohydrolase [Heliophilum fasciatum]MCW2278786.1 NTP pyrophosphatase (non-canonical NTP hydrolase) [Heliophilum fasciatum]TCP62457.1 NTP pyrophosphatase (non-canonical NTP hydrolase) [Heliophilum fasciatum]
MGQPTQPTLQDVQAQVDRYISQYKEGYFDPQVLILRFCEELGELSREVSHRYGPKKKKPSEADGDMALELGDLLFILVCFANAQGYDLADIFERTMAKYETRDRGRWTPK